MPHLTFRTSHRDAIEVDVPAQGTLLNVAWDHGIPGIIGDCGGSATCLTCHCYLVDGNLANVPPPRAHEVKMLELVLAARPESRLGCQVLVTDALDGLVIEVPDQQG